MFIDEDRMRKDEPIQMLVKNHHSDSLQMHKMFIIHANKYKRIDIAHKARKFYPGECFF
jgi:hypothetical protein